MRLSTLLALGLYAALASARGGHDNDHGGGDGDGDGDGTATSSAPSATSTGNVTSGGFGGDLTGLTGDSACNSLMCISAVVNGSVVEYILQSTGSANLGWMAMGFGAQMANTPMVIFWSNSDGSVTVSQRQASGEVMPTVVASPPRVATPLPSLTSLSGSTPKFGYSIPVNSDTKQTVIWAFGTTNPGSSAADAPLTQHAAGNSGTLSLDLTKALSSGSSVGDPAASGSGSGSSGSVSTPLLPFQKLVIAHAVVLGIAFLILLPAGALLARWLRTVSRHWFKGHWIIQFYLAGPLIVTGIGLGIGSVHKAGASHLDDTHKKWGIAIFVLYIVQCSLGGIIHFIKPKPKIDPSTGLTVPRARPPQNYSHAVLGLAVIALAFYQVRTGYKKEWPLTTGRGDAPKGVNAAWIAWVILLPVLYGLGLFLLPRQFHQERASYPTRNDVSLSPLSSHPSSQTHIARNMAATSGDDQDRQEHRAQRGDYLHVDGNDDEDEKNSYAHGDPDADNVVLTAPSTTSNRRNRSSSRSHTRHASSSSKARDTRSRSGSGTGSSSQATRMEMHERNAPRVTLPSNVTSAPSSISGSVRDRTTRY